MRKIAIYLFVTLISGGVAVPAALSHGPSYGGKNVSHKEHKSSSHKAKINWNQGKSHVHKNKLKPHQPIYKPNAKRKYNAPRHPVYYGHYKNPYYKRHFYKPTYVYVKPYKGYRYPGYYSYRGFYWPFAQTRFVINLSDRQIERHHRAVYSALDAPVGEVVSWYDKGRHGTIVVIREGVDSSGHLCKEYRQTISYRGRVTSQTGVSCLTSKGYWITA
ncbi:hypothetical protein NBZ79_04300 [Sneathiella marina]|uniref:Uncharacterized protein n=1 Tax=Sneathiella marina TaxID=2950108 RepID=A0ABY4W5B0_9PROT|nr:hypothetical protein [Sneathiella marina]USG62197.1 hypothetical protein NBZ79_04300 [Sneathiella marina]